MSLAQQLRSTYFDLRRLRRSRKSQHLLPDLLTTDHLGTLFDQGQRVRTTGSAAPGADRSTAEVARGPETSRVRINAWTRGNDGPNGLRRSQALRATQRLDCDQGPYPSLSAHRHRSERSRAMSSPRAFFSNGASCQADPTRPLYKTHRQA